MGLIVRGQFVITDVGDGEEGILRDGAVYFSEGRVSEVGEFNAIKEKYPEEEIKGNGRQLLMPGLIDGHSHGWGMSAIQRGTLFDYLENSLINWAGMFNLDPELNAVMSAIRHLRNGCTTMHHNNWGPNEIERAEKSIEAYRKVGIRLAYSPGALNENTLACDDTKFLKTLPQDLQEFCRPMVYYDKEMVARTYFEVYDYLYDRYHGDDIRIIHGPSWAHGCTDEFLLRVKESADSHGKLPIHIHTLQTPHQKAYGLKKYGKSLLDRLNDLGLVDENLTLGHAVYVTESDIELLASSRASVTHHPNCNFVIRNGIAPVYHMWRAGVNVSLGIDDKALNDDEDAIMELRLIHRLHRVSGFDLANNPSMDAFDVLKMGTISAARVCGFGEALGTLKPGSKADAILIDMEEIMEDPWMSPDLNIAEIFIHRAKGTHVNTVFVGGNVIMEDRKFLTVDVDQIYKDVREQANRGITEEQRLFAETLQKIKPYYHAWYDGWDKLEFDPFYIMNSRQ